jgi:hypothetical protein
MPVKPSSKYVLLVSIALAGIVLVLLRGPVPQNVDYHCFADARNLYGIPSFWNVISNVPFAGIGLAGMCMLVSMRENRKPEMSGLLFFLGIFFTGIGSAYYHWYPSNMTLVWDRLPMTVSFMAFFSIVISDCICKEPGRRLLWPLLFTGLLSVFYWQMTESRGQGDLRFYIIVQFLPMLLIPLIFLLFKTPAGSGAWYWMILLAYGIAKVFELLDEETFRATTYISGHTIKHLMAAMGPLIYLIFLKKRGNAKHVVSKTSCLSPFAQGDRHYGG